MEARSFCGAEMVRLHVLADSDRARAQKNKLIAVCAVRRAAAKACAGARDAREAYEMLSRAQGSMRRAARLALIARGCFRRVRVEMGVFPFPDRSYANAFVPAGDYSAVRVMIGRGAGRNWWCVIYPELCVVGEACARALTSGEAVRFYSGFARLISEWFGGGAA